MKKKIVLTAGGTGGHLFPAQAVAEAFPEEEILFIAGGLARNRFFDRERFAYQEVATATFSLSHPVKAIKGILRLLRGVWQSVRIFRKFSPDIVVGFGSFYTFPPLLAAWLCRIPLLLHEQNGIPGKVNRWFSRLAHTTAITFPESADYLSGRSRVVSFPLRMRGDQDPWAYFGLEKGRETLLIFGGSQGARRLNELILPILPSLHAYQILHFTGSAHEEVVACYRAYGLRHYVRDFEPHMPLAMRIADLAITRAGASTLAELRAHCLPAILIPFPYATENHQEKNAQYFCGGKVYREAELTPERLLEAILTFPKEEKRAMLNHEVQRHARLALPDLIKEIIDHG